MIVTMPTLRAPDGTSLHYDTLGDPALPALLLLAGGPGMDPRYLGDLGGLSRYRRLIRLHARATGLSAVPEDRASCGFAAQAADVEALRERLGLDRFDLLAHSAGSLVAQAYAAGRPGRVRRLVLVAPVGRAAREADEAEIAAIRASRSGEPWYERARAAQETLERDDLTPAEQRRFQAMLLPFFWGTWDEGLRASQYSADLVPPGPWIRDAFYTAPSASAVPGGGPWPPTLVVAGGRDGMIGTAPARLVATARPGAELHVLEDCGHRPWGERPERFTALVEGFLSA